MGPGTMPLYERETEWDVLADALSAPDGRLIWIEGPPGVGKTRLMDAALAEAGGCLLRGRGIERERDFPFGVVLQLFEPVVSDDLFSGAAALASPLFSGEPLEVESAHALAHGLFWLACNIAERKGGASLFVDDVQWCDAGSLVFLAYLVERLADLPLTVVVARRSGEVSTPADAMQIRSRADALLQPQPFTRPTVDVIVRDVFTDAAPEFVDACADVSGGNPFFLRELLRSLRSDEVEPNAASAADVEGIVPETVLASVVGRLGRLSSDAVALAGAIAVIGDGASMRLAGAMSELDMRSTQAAADLLADAQVLEPGEPLAFTHALIASAVEADLPALAKARAHRAAAKLISADGGPIEEVASHLLACPGEGEAWAVDTLAAAADRATARGDGDAECRLLARALEEPPAPERRGDLLLSLACAATAIGRADAAQRMAEALTLIDDPRVRALARRATGRLQLARARYADSASSLEAGLDELDGDDPLAEQLLADLLGVWFFIPGQQRANESRLSALIDSMRERRSASDTSLLAPIAATLALQGRDVSSVRGFAEASLASLGRGRDASHGVLSAFAIASLLYVDEFDAAEGAIEAELERARARGSAVATAIACHWRARIWYRQGRLAESVASAQEALDLGRDRGWTAAILAEALIDRGELDQASEVVSRVESADTGGFEHAFLLFVRGKLALARGNDASAVDDLRAAGAHLLDHFGFDNPIMLGWREPAVLAAIRLGDEHVATSLAQECLAVAQRFPSPGIRGSALRTTGLTLAGEDALRTLSEAVAILDGSPAALERARALIDLGAAIRRAGRRVDAREPLMKGLELAHRCGARPLVERATEELHAAGARPRRIATSGVDSLTPSELRVTKLAAQGLANKQIAQALFVTTKTVETHLRNAFLKLHVRTRDELAHALAGPSEIAPAART